MRIVVNGWFWNQTTAGSGQYLSALAAVLPRVGKEHEFVLALPEGRDAAHLPAGWQAVEVPVPLARVNTNLGKVWFEQATFPRLCRRLAADVAFTPYWGSAWWRPCPTVVTVHDLIPLLLPLYRGGLLQRLYIRLVSATARRAAVVLTDSEASRRDIVQHLRIPAQRVYTVYLAADQRDQTVRVEDEAALRARLGLPLGPFLLYLGGFDPRKNLRRTIEGYALLVRRCAADNVSAPPLVIAGRLPRGGSSFAVDPRPIVGALGLSDLVYFTGWVDDHDKAALYRLATAVVFVSEYEGFGLPVLEAMVHH